MACMQLMWMGQMAMSSSGTMVALGIVRLLCLFVVRGTACGSGRLAGLECTRGVMGSLGTVMFGGVVIR